MFNLRVKSVIILCCIQPFIPTLGALVFSQTRTSGVTVNYARVIEIDTCAQTITFDSPSPFQEKQVVVIHQVGGAEYDTSLTPEFGELCAVNSAGQFELLSVTGVTGSSLAFSNPLMHSYNVQGMVQVFSAIVGRTIVVDSVLSVRKYADGLGGIVVIIATDTLFVNSDIDANGSGFKGGFPSISGFDTNRLEPVFNDLDGASGYHGETMCYVRPTLRTGRNALCTGGGGGNARNSGGGGGALGGKGGSGGYQTNEFEVLDNGGLGGHSLSDSVFVHRAFYGGGGGGGHQNDFLGTSGGSGGGCIVLLADVLVMADQALLSAQGANATSARDDGAGGGGAGGSIIVNANQAPKRITIDVSGGKGGNTTGTLRCYGPGGGGSGGMVWTSDALKPNLYCTLNGGNSGVAQSSNPTCSERTSYGATPGFSGEIRSIPNNAIFKSVRKGLGVLLTRDTVCEGELDTLVVTNGTIVSAMDFGRRISVNPDTVIVGPVFTSSQLKFTVLTSYGCELSINKRIIVLPAPIPELSNADTIVNSELDSVLFTTRLPYARYLWSNGSQQSSVLISGNQSVSVRVWTDDGCSGESTTSNVIVSKVAGQIEIEIGDVSGTPGETIQVPITVRVIDTLTVQCLVTLKLTTNASCLIPQTTGILDSTNISTFKSFQVPASISKTYVESVSMTCALGDSVTSAIHATVQDISPNQIGITVASPSNFTLLGVCNSGSKPRLFTPYTVVKNTEGSRTIRLPIPDDSINNIPCIAGRALSAKAVSLQGNEIPIHAEVRGNTVLAYFPNWVSGLVALSVEFACWSQTALYWIE